MRSSLTKVCLFLLLVFSQKILRPASLDGIPPAARIYIEGVYNSFVDGDFVRGYVKFARARTLQFYGEIADIGGFTVPAGGTLSAGIGEIVDGDINLNGGTLVLTSDLYLNGNINGSGEIQLRGFTIHFLRNVTLNGPVDIVSRVSLGTLDFNGNTLSYSGNGALRLQGGDSSTLAVRNAVVNNANATRFLLGQFVVTLRLENVLFRATEVIPLWQMNTNLEIFGKVTFDATGGSLVFSKQEVGLGAGRITIKTGSTLKFGRNTIFENRARVNFESPDSILMFEDSIYTGVGNILGNNINEFFGGNIVIKGDVSFMTNSLIYLGDGISSTNNTNLTILPASTLNLVGTSLHDRSVS